MMVFATGLFLPSVSWGGLGGARSVAMLKAFFIFLFIFRRFRGAERAAIITFCRPPVFFLLGAAEGVEYVICGAIDFYARQCCRRSTPDCIGILRALPMGGARRVLSE